VSLEPDPTYWCTVDTEGRPADTALADVESPWPAAPAIVDENADPAYWDWLSQGPSPPGCTSPAEGELDQQYWERVYATDRPADTALADVEAVQSRISIPDPGDPEPGYWDWLCPQEGNPTANAGAVSGIEPPPDGNVEDDADLAYWEARIAEEEEQEAAAAPPASSAGSRGPGQEQAGSKRKPRSLEEERAPLAPPDPAVLAYLRGEDEAAEANVPEVALNPRQQDAVERSPGPVMVIAGPGSGKTRVLTQRVAHLVRSGAAVPETVLAVTFTRQAAREMQSRLATALPNGDGEGITVCTFHRLGLRILQTEAGSLDVGIKSHFSVYGNGPGDAILRRALKQAGVEERYWPLDDVRGHVSRFKTQLRTPEELLAAARDPRAQTLARIYQAYQAGMQEANAVDYDDLLALPARILLGDRDARAAWAEHCAHVLVDEFQDTNPLQYVLVEALAGEHRDVTVVGSPAQSIYAWRGADGLRALARFRQDFQPHEVILEEHYRCTGNILAAAQALIQGRDYGEQALRTANAPGELIGVVSAATDVGEARFVAGEIERLVELGYRFRDVAVLYRVREQSDLLERMLLDRRIPYTIVGERLFFQRPEVQAALGYLRLAFNPQDMVSLAVTLNTPPRGFGYDSKGRAAVQDRFGSITLESLQGADRERLAGWQQERLDEYLILVTERLPRAAEELPADELLDYVLRESGYAQWIDRHSHAERRRASLRILRAIAAQYDHLPPLESLAGFLAEVEELDTVDDWGADEELVAEYGEEVEDAGAVVLSTLHAAKGREYPVVFIVGYEENLLPHYRSLGVASELEEERRLAYMGLTRAQERLYLSFAQHRQRRGGEAFNGRPSRFLNRLPRHVMSLQKVGG